MKQKFYLLIALLLFSIFSITQGFTQAISEPYTGETGITKKISELQDNAGISSQTLRANFLQTLRPNKFFKKKFQGTGKSGVNEEEDVLEGTESDNLNGATKKSTFDMALPGKSATQEIGSNYQGSNFDDLPLWPPDPNGAVGSSQVIVLTNAGFRVFEKQTATDAPLVTPKGYSKKIAPSQFYIGLDKFFSPVLPSGNYTFDPHIRYDRLSKRWYIVCVEANASGTNNYVLMAVSRGERVTDSSSFTYYRFPSALIPYSPAERGAPFLDYPTLGVDKNAVMIGGVQFMYSGDSVYFVGYAVDKQRLLQGLLRLYVFKLGVYNFLNGVQTGMGVPQGVHNDDPLVNSSFFIGNDFVTLKNLFMTKVNFNNLGNVTGLFNTTLPVAPYNAAREVTSPGALQPIDPLDTRLFAASIHKNKLTGTSSLWTAHAVGVNPAGNFVSDANFEKRARNSSRWYELGDVYGTPTVSQLGNVYDASEPSGRRATQFFNPSIAASGQGHAVISGTVAAFDEYLNVFVAGRYAGDENSTMNKPVKATKTTALYAPFLPGYGYIGRWGDYSQTVVDPMDDQTIWTFQEYANVDDKYGVRVVQLKAPPPPQTILPLGAFSNRENSTVTIEGVPDDYSGFFDPGNDVGGPGYNRLSVKSTGGITVTNVKLESPTKITFTLNTNRKQTGKYTLIITNPDGQLVTVDYRINNREATVTSSTNLQSNSIQVDKVAQSFITASRVFPNPTSGNVNIQVTAAKDHEARIIMVDLSGKLMYEKYFNFGKGSNNAVLSLSGLVKGTYFAGVYNSENVLIAKHKIVKE